MVTDLLTEPIVGVSSFPTQTDPGRFIKTLAAPAPAHRSRTTRTSASARASASSCPAWWTARAPASRSRRASAGATSRCATCSRRRPACPVHIENSGRACAIAQVWGVRREAGRSSDFVFLSVSDGLGVGVVVNGEVVRGRHNVAGEFGHVPLERATARPARAAPRGCWEAYVSNLATLSRYFGRELSPRKPIPAEIASFTVDDLVARARGGDGKAVAALQSTAHYLGLGLASVVNAVDPARIFISGEIIAAWDLIEATVRQALASRVLAPAASSIEITPVPLAGPSRGCAARPRWSRRRCSRRRRSDNGRTTGLRDAAAVQRRMTA